MDLTDDERDLILAGLFELTITYVEDDENARACKALAERLGGDPDAMFYGAPVGGCDHEQHLAYARQTVGGVVSVLFTSDRRVFFQHDDGTIRVAADWERDEVLLQLLAWQSVAATRQGPAGREEPAEP